MPNRAISDDVKRFAMRLMDGRKITIEDCATYGAFSVSTAKRLREHCVLR